jgi:hypothetical protein
MVTRRRRSSPYPSYDIEYCLNLVKRIYDNFGSGNYYAKREELAKTLGISEGHLQTQVSSATQYGLLELKSGEGYKPTKLFIAIIKPINESQKNESLIQAFKSPNIYTSIIDKFENEKLPTLMPLSNILLQHFSFSDVASEKAASIFIDNAKYLKLLTEDNVLKLTNDFNDTDKNSTDLIDELRTENTGEIVKVETFEKDDNINSNIKIETEFTPFNILLKGRKRAQLLIPNDIVSSDFDTIINWIRLMKESF